MKHIGQYAVVYLPCLIAHGELARVTVKMLQVADVMCVGACMVQMVSLTCVSACMRTLAAVWCLRDEGSTRVCPAVLLLLCAGVDAPEASATQAPQQQAALQCHIEAWGAWTGLHTSSHLPSASDASSAASVASQVPALAHHLAGLLLTVHEAEAQRKAGEDKRSLALLQGALKKADSMSVAWTDKGQTTGGPGGGGAAQVIVRLGDCQLLRKQVGVSALRL